MATELKTGVAEYRLLHFQPDPEDGDRVCVGLLIRDGGRYSIAYDRSFPKLRCIAPSFELELVKFFLDDLELKLQESSSPIEVAMKESAPQLLVSKARQITSPVTEAARLRLLRRFVLSESMSVQAIEDAELTAAEVSDDHLRVFVQELVGTPDRIVTRARPQDLFGKKIKNVASVAVAVRTQTAIMLIDGIDLRVLTPTKAIHRANRVTHTFWQYGKLRTEDIAVKQTPFQRVGLVLNGVSAKTDAYEDAYEYAVHQFSKEADLLVDTASGQGRQQLQRALAATQAM